MAIIHARRALGESRVGRFTFSLSIDGEAPAAALRPLELGQRLAGRALATFTRGFSVSDSTEVSTAWRPLSLPQS